MIRSDKMRRFTKPECDWFFALMKLVHRCDDYVHIPFPEAWQYFDNGSSPEETFLIYEQN